jgi:hypothetical protein
MTAIVEHNIYCEELCQSKICCGGTGDSQIDYFMMAITSVEATFWNYDLDCRMLWGELIARENGRGNNVEGVVLAYCDWDLYSNLARCLGRKCAVSEAKIPRRDCSGERPHCPGK